MTCKMGISINSINNTYGKCVWSHNKVLFIKVYKIMYLPTYCEIHKILCKKWKCESEKRVSGKALYDLGTLLINTGVYSTVRLESFFVWIRKIAAVCSNNADVTYNFFPPFVLIQFIPWIKLEKNIQSYVRTEMYFFQNCSRFL